MRCELDYKIKTNVKYELPGLWDNGEKYIINIQIVVFSYAA